MATLGDPDRGRRPTTPRARSQEEQGERRSQQGDQDGPQSSQGLDVEPGRPTDKASSQGMPDHGFHEGAARRASASSEDDVPVNTGGRPGADNTD